MGVLVREGMAELSVRCFWCMCRLGGVKSSMKVISYNIWGLGGFDKRNEMLIMVQEKTHFVMCLQESNVGLVDDLLVQSIWGSSSCGYSFQPFNAAFGGLLYVWDSSEVEVWSFMSFEHVLVIKGRVIITGQEFVVVNVYAPYHTATKQILWDRLLSFIHNHDNADLCLCGDFNSIRSQEE